MAGRPKNSKDSTPRTRKPNKRPAKIKNVPAVINTDESVKKANDIFIKNLSGDMQKLYKIYATDKTTPIEDLKDLANTMKARYKIALQTEMSEYNAFINQAKKDYKELEETKKVDGKNKSEIIVNKRLKVIQVMINRHYKISSTVTTLGESFRNLLIDIERIESGTVKGTVNIFQILNSTEMTPQIQKLQDTVFPDVMDPDIMDDEDIEFIEEEDAKEPE